MNQNYRFSPTLQEESWIQATSEMVSERRWLVRYAEAINTLSTEPLLGTLSPALTYESQSVFSEMAGAREVLCYLSDKMRAIKRSGATVAVELANFPNAQPCAVLYQARSPRDTNWLDEPVAAMTVEVDEFGLAKKMLTLTVAPSPTSAVLSGLFPGLAQAPVARRQAFIRWFPDFREIVLYVFFLDGECGLDERMSESIAQATELLPGIRLQGSTACGQTECGGNFDDNDLFGFVGFPSVGATFRGQVIFRHQGLIDGGVLAEKIKALSPLSLSAGSAE